MTKQIQLLILIFYMGLLNNLFGQKKYPEDWNFYLTEIDGKLASISLNLALKEFIPNKEKPNLTWIYVKLNSPSDKGLTTDEESEILFDIEDQFLGKINRNNSLYIGRLTSDGSRDFYFYSKNSDLFKSEAEKISREYPNYKILIHSKEDKDWNSYLDIYPSELDFQSISNRSVLENLEKNGDNLSKAREVFHWIYFNNEIDRTNYIDAILKENFVVAEENFDKMNQLPFGLQIKRVDYVGYNEIDEYTLLLWKLARENNGDYDNWETSVEKD